MNLPLSTFYCSLSTRAFRLRQGFGEQARGFTLVELLVTLSIFLVMTSVVLARYRSFSVNTDFVNTVEDIVLSLREAQVYGSASKAVEGGGCGGSVFDCAYGVNFVNGGTSYVVFVDANVDGMYSSDEAVQANNFPSGITTTGIPPASPLNVVFKRPFPAAIINNDPINTSASITVSDSKSGKLQKITISSTGMISVQ